MVIQSSVAGIDSKDLNVSIEDGVLMIKGKREKPLDFPESVKKYLYQECYWGPFHRSLLMPEEIDPEGIKASVKDGILTVRIPKTNRKGKKEIEIR
jgi:HSP20 family protein